MILSIIVPIYNVERYLRECLNSIRDSSFSDWECILVDDGSPDNSGIICDEYAQLDDRFKVVHKLNGGVSSARNAGLDVAQGEWIGFVDSDDFVSKTLFENLLSPVLHDESIDFVQGGCTNWKNGEVVGINQKYEDYVGIDPAKVFNEFRGLTVSKLFRLENVNHWNDGLPLRFDEKMIIAEDMAFTLDYLMTVKKYAFVSEVGYYYRQDNLFSATRSIRKPNYIEQKVSFSHLWESTFDYIAKNNLNDAQSKIRLIQRSEGFTQMLKSLYYGRYSHHQRIEEIRKWQESGAYRTIIDIDIDNKDWNMLRNNRLEEFDMFNLWLTRIQFVKDTFKHFLFNGKYCASNCRWIR